MAYDEVQSPLSRGVGGVRSHAGFELSIGADGDSGQISRFAKSPIAIVVKEEVGHVVVGDENVLPAVVVVVERHHSETVPALYSDSGGLVDVGDSAVAIVAIQRSP